MKSKLSLLFALLMALATVAQAAEPLRVFIRGGKKTHGPGQHEHEQFLNDWKKLLAERGCQTDGGMEFPTAAQLAKTDVLILHSQEGGEIPADQRPGMEAFLKRGGGVVVVHAAAVPKNGTDGAAYLKSVVGGSWVWGTTKWLEGPMSLYYVDRTHAITTGVANYDMNDEIYYDLDLSPDIRVLAAAYTPKTANTARPNGVPQAGKISVYDIQPQMWTYESQRDGGQPYRAFVHIPGHLYKNFSMPHFRAVLLRGIAWAGKRSNIDEFCQPAELASLRYPEGGPSRPEKSVTQISVHPDFKMTLVASEPLINKVMNMDWDAQGRLWVCETPEYPDGRYANKTGDVVQNWVEGKLNPETGRWDRPAYDRISILTDADANGVYQKKQIFADFQHGVPGGIELVTSFVHYKDGVIVSAAPDVWWMRDTNGDGVCDKVERLYTNLGTRDTHSLINNLRWGFDGWIYATHGYSSSSNVTTGDGSKGFGTIGSGLVRFKPDGSNFEQVSSKGGNTWGLQVTWDNELFWTQPTSGDLLMNTVLSENTLGRGKITGTTSYKVVRRSPKIYPPIPYDQLPYVQIDWVGSFTAAAGTVVYDGGSWPSAWNYSYFCTEPTVNIVHHEIVKPEGVSYTMSKAPEREEMEFIAGRDMWFRPIEVRTGPDGAMYVIDFYNQAVIHNDTRGTKHGPRNAAIRPDRDHYYSRIWRVDHKDAKKLDVPNLTKSSGVELVQTLEVPNRHTRMNALRLLVEKNPGDSIPALKKLLVSQKSPESRVAAVWALARLNQLDEVTFTAVASDASPAIRKNVMRVAAAQPAIPVKAAQQAALRDVNDPDPQVRLAALVALQNFDFSETTAKTLVLAWPSFDDQWSQSAFLGAAARAPEKVFAAALASPNAAALASLTSKLGPLVASSAAKSGQLVIALSRAPASADTAKAGALEGLTSVLKLGENPTWDAALQSALQTLANSADARVSAAALPFIAKWDTGGSMKAELQKDIGLLLVKLGDASQPDDTRVSVVTSLLGMRQENAQIVPAVVKLLGATGSTALKLRVIQALSEVSDTGVGALVATVYPQLNPELQTAAFDLLVKRAEWSLALLDALQSGQVPATAVGPGNAYRLRTHPIASVATRAKTVLDALRGPEAKEKQALIEKFVPVVTQSGNVAKGKELFTANCATCHKIGELGNEVGPNLTGMGAHGPEELLTAVLDPNREVDPSFVAFSVETRDGEIYDGVVVRQNATSIVLKNAAGEKDIPRTSIKSQRNTGRSLMPEGFEALTGDGLRDILTFICADYARFRFIDLTSTFTASTKNGLYSSARESGGTLPVSKFGIVNALGVPFKVADPAKQPGGNNVMVLKGGPDEAHSKTLPQKVEAKVGHAVKQLHILGNVAGWGFPYGGGQDVPALKITVVYADGTKEELAFKNGVEFADYIREVNVPGSKLAPGIADGGKQMRLVSKPLTGKGVVEKLIFESYNNGLAPTTLAVTADLSNDPLPAAPKGPAIAGPAPNQKGGKKGGKGKNAPAPVQVASAAPGTLPPGLPAPSAAPFDWKGAGVKVLLVGGGSSHDFNKFFNLADVAILKGAGMAVNYTESPVDTVRELKNVDAVVLSVNRGEWATPELRKALFDFAAAGKGIVLLHAGVWYNFKDWPEYNNQIVGGGSRGHDKLGDFSVNVIKDHPITKGVSKTFPVTDELYYMNATPAPDASPIEVLVQTSNSIKFMTPHPSVWLVKHPHARIAGIALGHDEKVHDLPDFQKLLINAVNWSAGK